MIVVADTTPLHYLVFIEADHVLGSIFGTVYVPPEVLNVELQGKKIPDVVKRWAQSPPAWLIEKAPTQIDPTLPEPPDAVRQLFGRLWAEACEAAMRVHEPEREAFARERQEHERARGEMAAEIARLEAELEAERERAAQAVATLTAERDTLREEHHAMRAALAAAEGARDEARMHLEREKEQNRELSERVIAEASKARSLAARVEELERTR